MKAINLLKEELDQFLNQFKDGLVEDYGRLYGLPQDVACVKIPRKFWGLECFNEAFENPEVRYYGPHYVIDDGLYYFIGQGFSLIVTVDEETDENIDYAIGEIA